MKTTIDLPDELFLQAKRRALEHGTTLKALIEMGLRTALVQSVQRNNTPYRLPVIATMAQPVAGDGDLNTFIDQMRSDQLEQLLPR
jgi:hypothetical protein